MIKKEYEVLLQFIKEPWEKFTFKEIKKLSGKKSESYIYNSLKRFVKDGILKEEKAGNVVLYFLNLGNLRAQSYAGFTSEYVAWKQAHIPYKNLQNIIDKIPTHFYIFLIAGSYANKTQKSGSDIDAVVIVDDTVPTRKVYAELKHFCELNIPQIHLYVFTKSEFLQMLLNKEANYGKEIAKNNLILFGAENYYKIMRDAVDGGFKN